MNARDKILSYDEDNRENLSDLLDAFAHELAEEIRDGRPQWGDAWRHYGEAADLIDPMAESTSQRRGHRAGEDAP